MKNMKKYITFLLLLISLGFTGCKESFLERDPQDKLTTQNLYTTAAGLKAGTAPLYTQVWFDFNTRPSYLLGDIRAGNCYSPYGYPQYSLFTLTSLDDNLYGAWKSFYIVVAQSTAIYNNIVKYSAGVTDAQKNVALAECLFMRSTAYFYLVRGWGNIPIIEDNSALLENPQVPVRSVSDVYRYIIRDLKFAVRNLPLQSDAGRINKFSAAGMLAKVYLSRSGYGSTNGMRNQADLDSAKLYAGYVCKNYPKPLLPNYADLFKYKFSNNQESLFSLQWVPLGDWGTQNATLSDFAFSTDVTGGAAAWGSTMASYDILRTYEKADTLRRNATFMTRGTYYPEINMADGGYRYPGYKVGSTDTCTSAHFKKYVPGGKNDENDGYVMQMNSPLKTYMLRLADIYLVYAEASLGNSPSISSGDGFDYLNKVRVRAGLKPRTSVTMDSIMYERRIELAMEWQLWYDMISWSYFMPDKILNMINNQHREASYKYYKKKDGQFVIWIDKEPNNPATNVKLNQLYFPIPEMEAISDPLLLKDPVPMDIPEE